MAILRKCSAMSRDSSKLYNKVLVYIILPFILLTAGCTCAPQVNQAYWEPPYLCAGDYLNFCYDVDCVDKIELWSADGSFLGSCSGCSDRSGCIRTDKGIVEAHLPIEIRGFSPGDVGKIQYVPKIIDQPEWTAKYYVKSWKEDNLDHNFEWGHLIWKEERKLVSLRTEEVEILDESGKRRTEEIEVYEVFDKIKGYTFNIPASHFSPRAKVINILNSTLSSLVFTPPNSSDTISVPKDTEMDDWSTSYQPGGTWTAMVPEEEQYERYLGEQWGGTATPPKPPLYPEQGLHVDPDIPSDLYIKLKVKCK